MTFMSTIHDHKASYHVLSKHVLVPMLHHCRSLVDGRPFRYFLDKLHTWTQPFHVLTDARNHEVHVNDQRPQGIISCLEQAWFGCPSYIAVVVSSMADPSDFSLNSFILELSRFTSLQTLEIMTFMSTIQRPQGIISCLEQAWFVALCYIAVVVSSMADPSDISLKALYLNLDVSRPFRRLKSWCSCRRFNDHKAS